MSSNQSPFINPRMSVSRNRGGTSKPRSLITDTKTHIRPTHPTELPSSIMADQNDWLKMTTTLPPNVLSHLNSSTKQTEPAQFGFPQFRNRSPYGIANQRRWWPSPNAASRNRRLNRRGTTPRWPNNRRFMTRWIKRSARWLNFLAEFTRPSLVPPQVATQP